MDDKDVIAALVHAVHTQHQAIDTLLAKLCTADHTFRPTQSGEIWSAVETGHKALQDWMKWKSK